MLSGTKATLFAVSSVLADMSKHCTKCIRVKTPPIWGSIILSPNLLMTLRLEMQSWNTLCS